VKHAIQLGGQMPARVPLVLVPVLLLIMGLLAGSAAWHESVTYDEVAHIGAGLSYLQRLDLRLNPEHPPLAKVLAALPLAIAGARADYAHPSWAMSTGFFSAFVGQLLFGESVLKQWNQPAATLRLARTPMLCLTLFGGWLVYRISRKIGNRAGGLLSLAIYVSTPLFLAMGPLVDTDMAGAIFTLAAIWTFARLLAAPSTGNTLWFSISLAAALLSKYSTLSLPLSLALVLISFRWGSAGLRPEAKKARRRALAKGLIGSGILIYAILLLLSSNQPTLEISVWLPGGGGVAVVRRLLLPLTIYLRGTLFVLATANRATFLFGHTYPGGVWFYFPVLLALKSPPGFLFLLLLAGVLGVLAKFQLSRTESDLGSAILWRTLWISFLVQLAGSMVTPLNIGFRHFSAPLAILTVLIARLPMLINRCTREGNPWMPGLRWTTAFCALLCLGGALLAYPNYLPYANIFSFGQPPYWLFHDSNADWGQSLPAVQKFMQDRDINRIRVDAFGFTSLNSDIPSAQMWDCQQPEPSDAGEWVAVSANMILSDANCGWLLQHEHTAVGGASMYVIHLPDPIPPAGSIEGPPRDPGARMFRSARTATDDRRTFATLMEHPADAPALGLRTAAQFHALTIRYVERVPLLKRLMDALPPQ